MMEEVCAILRRHAAAVGDGAVYEADFAHEIVTVVRECLAQRVGALQDGYRDNALGEAYHAAKRDAARIVLGVVE